MHVCLKPATCCRHSCTQASKESMTPARASAQAKGARWCLHHPGRPQLLSNSTTSHYWQSSDDLCRLEPVNRALHL